MQRLEVWRLLNPAPLPGTVGLDPDPRIAIGEQFEALLRSVPGFMESHPMEAHEPDEELWLMEQSFAAAVPSLRLHLPQHRVWMSAHQDYAYACARDYLRYLQWQDGGHGGRPWVLKSPVHIGQLETLLGLYPDATFVQLHRDPRTVVGSFCSLIESARRMNCDDVDPLELGPDFCAFWGRQTERNLSARAAHPELRILDVDYARLRDDFDAVLHEIYERADRPVTPEAQAGFEAYTARRPAGYFGSHEYDPDRWGVTHELVAESFAQYLDAFPQLRAA
jgi:hypothetical protein